MRLVSPFGREPFGFAVIVQQPLRPSAWKGTAGATAAGQTGDGWPLASHHRRTIHMAFHGSARKPGGNPKFRHRALENHVPTHCKTISHVILHGMHICQNAAAIQQPTFLRWGSCYLTWTKLTAGLHGQQFQFQDAALQLVALEGKVAQSWRGSRSKVEMPRFFPRFQMPFLNHLYQLGPVPNHQRAF